VLGQPGHPAEHLERLDIEVGPLGAPLRGELVDLVAQFSLTALLSRS
jgi:hypothetical protein